VCGMSCIQGTLLVEAQRTHAGLVDGWVGGAGCAGWLGRVLQAVLRPGLFGSFKGR
jgi:hypothetical protein